MPKRTADRFTVKIDGQALELTPAQAKRIAKQVGEQAKPKTTKRKPFKGSSLWKASTKEGAAGRPAKFESPSELWQKACNYFQWVEDNPIKEEKVFHNQGQITRAEVGKMRAMTLDGLCLHLDTGTSTLHDYESKDGFSEVITRIKQVIREQKFTGAAADMLNPNIIARDLGLTDKTDSKITVQAVDDWDDV